MSQIKKVALVTGASQPHGIGRSAAMALARGGIDVAVTGFSHFDGAQSVAEEIKQLGRNAIAVKMNVEDYEDVDRGMALIKDSLGPVNILVNNAAQMGQFITIDKMPVDAWHKAVYTTLFSAYHCIRAVWADMTAGKWGRIINITSIAGTMGGYGQTPYSAAKAGIIGLTKSVALEGARFNITSNAVLVGVAKTDAPMGDEVKLKLEKRLLTRRLAEPQEIADAISYLVDDKSQYMSGAVMNMLGGLDLFVF
jgi:3-oxoacyl-[acyl-carrier protein] reductase